MEPLLSVLHRCRRALARGRAGRADLVPLLALDHPADVAWLHREARRCQRRASGPAIHLHGLIELSNRCRRDCLYCAGRRDNAGLRRFSLDRDAIGAAALRAREGRLGAVELVAGECRDDAFTEFVARAVDAVRGAVGPEAGVSLSCGAQPAAVYRRWRDAGADRYLLRLGTTDPDLDRMLHPCAPRLEERLEALRELRSGGWQVGSGVMIGLPAQTLHDVADDLLFLRDEDVDTLHLGPFVPDAATPLADTDGDLDGATQLRIALNAVAVARLLLPEVNLMASPSLDVLSRRGRDRALLAGANVITAPLPVPPVTEGEGQPADDGMADGDARLDALLRHLWRLGAPADLGARGDPRRWRRRLRETV